MRRTDVIGRYGGEEFVVVLPECSGENARELLDDVRGRNRVREGSCPAGTGR